MLDYLIDKSLSGSKWYEYYIYPFISLGFIVIKLLLIIVGISLFIINVA